MVSKETLDLNDCFFRSSHRYETKPPQTFPTKKRVPAKERGELK